MVIQYSVAILAVLWLGTGTIIPGMSQNQDAGPDSVVAVLENPQCKESHGLTVRALFARTPDGWVALTNQTQFEAAGIQPDMLWFAQRGGVNRGKVRLESTFPDVYSEETFSRDIMLPIVDISGVSLDENADKKFVGWCWAPTYHPLVLTTQNRASNPAGWRSVPIDSTVCKKLFSAFLSVNDNVVHCPETWEEAIPFNYEPEDLLTTEHYEAKNGRQLVALRLDLSKNGCDGPPGPAWRNTWFLIDDEPVLIGRKMELVDVGDYDGNGQSEALFWYSGYNMDGYTLFYDDFSRRVDFWWNYH